MDEYLSEKEQLQQIREWWRENGWYLIGGAALGVLALFGYNRWEESAAAAAEGASELYRQVETAATDDDADTVAQLLAILRSEHAGSPYVDQASLLLARLLIVSDPVQAIDLLRGVMDNTDDAELSVVARLRLARVLAYRERYDEALMTIDSDDFGPFTARAHEIRGDIFLAQENLDGARAEFTQALITDGSDIIDRNYVSLKLGSLAAGAGGVSGGAVLDAAGVLEVPAAAADAAPEAAVTPDTDSPAADAAGESAP